jgi:hypothetical protein
LIRFGFTAIKPMLSARYAVGLAAWQAFCSGSGGGDDDKNANNRSSGSNGANMVLMGYLAAAGFFPYEVFVVFSLFICLRWRLFFFGGSRIQLLIEITGAGIGAAAHQLGSLTL